MNASIIKARQVSCRPLNGHSLNGAGSNPAPYLLEKLAQAELLLSYAAEMGIKTDDSVRSAILKARGEIDGHRFAQQTADDLLVALTTLAAAVRPVTVESLRASADRTRSRGEVQFYGRVAKAVGFIIVVFSLCTFVSNRLSDQITKDIDTANSLAAKLTTELGPASAQPADATVAATVAGATNQDAIWFGTNGIPRGLSDKDVISDLQQFAATMRKIHGYTGELKHFLFNFKQDPYQHDLEAKTKANQSRRSLELTPGLNVRLSQELTDRVEEYQIVRSFANGVQQRVAVFYGAIATCVLPVLYALLGAGAYLLRTHEDQLKNRTLTEDNRHTARFLIAGIAGLVIGLFNNVTGGVTIPPLALAFLAGYAVDVFFNFLEGFLRVFRGVNGAAQSGVSK